VSNTTFVENLTTAGWFFIQIAAELTILFIVITFIVGMIQEYLPAERIKKSLEQDSHGRSSNN